MDELLAVISKEQIDRFSKPWCKLDKGSKKNRIINFSENYECSEEDKILLKNLLVKLYNNNILKNDFIEYNSESSMIINIKNLSYNDKQFQFTPNAIKHKMKSRSSKTKTKVERHLTRGKKSDSKTI